MPTKDLNRTASKGVSPHIPIVMSIFRSAGFMVRKTGPNKVLIFLRNRPIDISEVMTVIRREGLPISRQDLRSTGSLRKVIIDLRDSAKAAGGVKGRSIGEIKRERDARAFEIKRQRKAERQWIGILSELSHYWKWAKTTPRFDERTQADYERDIIMRIRAIGITGPRNGIQQDFGQLDILGESFDQDPKARDKTRRQIINRLKNMIRKAKASRKFHQDKRKKLERGGKSAKAADGGKSPVKSKTDDNVVKWIWRYLPQLNSAVRKQDADEVFDVAEHMMRLLYPHKSKIPGFQEASGRLSTNLDRIMALAERADDPKYGDRARRLPYSPLLFKIRQYSIKLQNLNDHYGGSAKAAGGGRKTKRLVADLGRLKHQADAYARVAPRNTNKNNVKLFGGLMRNWKKMLAKYPELNKATRNSTVPQMMKPGTFIRGGKGDPKGYFLAIADGLKYLALMAPKYVNGRKTVSGAAMKKPKNPFDKDIEKYNRRMDIMQSQLRKAEREGKPESQIDPMVRNLLNTIEAYNNLRKRSDAWEKRA